MKTARRPGSAKQATVYHFDISLAGASVDRDKGVIEGVSLMTTGKARGHDLAVDATTLKQVLACSEELGQVPVKWNHKTGADAVNGFITNFRMDGNKLRGDWHLLKTHAQYEQAMELAERMPSNVGLSAAFRGEPEGAGKVKKARCEEILAFDLVAHPAANPDGLFARPEIDRREISMDTNPDTTQQAAAAETPTLADVVAEIHNLRQRVSDLEDFADELHGALTADPDGEGEPDPDEAEMGRPLTRGDLIEFERQREERLAEAGRKQATEAAFGVLEQKVETLLSRNEELVTQLGALAEENKALQAGQKPASRSSGGDNPPKRATTVHAFDQRVEELTKDGKMTKAAAIQFAVKEDGDRYADYLATRGVVNL